MKAVVGIGNPGKEYALTRHNVGFRAIDELARILRIECDKRRYSSIVGGGGRKGEKVLLLKPRTYVNLTGKAVRQMADSNSCPVEDILIVCDDFQLPLGVARLKPRGSAGGHNGLASVARELGTTDYPRLRLGIGVEGASRDKDFVLSKFENDEQDIVEDMIRRAAEAALCWIDQGIDRAMEICNRKDRRQENEQKEEEAT